MTTEPAQLDLPSLASLGCEETDFRRKKHFKIGEVADLLDLEAYVLRYWEKEFQELEPSKTDSGQRAYTQHDIRMAATIQRLVHTEKFTLDGARRQLELHADGEPCYLSYVSRDSSEASDAPDRAQSDDGAERWREAAQQVQAENETLSDEIEVLRRRIETLQEERDSARQRAESLGDQRHEAISALRDEVEALAELGRPEA
jgi:DNA-binding transcriptional MerR regulator